jgi:hypothetical protein
LAAVPNEALPTTVSEIPVAVFTKNNDAHVTCGCRITRKNTKNITSGCGKKDFFFLAKKIPKSGVVLPR